MGVYCIFIFLSTKVITSQKILCNADKHLASTIFTASAFLGASLVLAAMARAACNHLIPSLVHPLKLTLYRNQPLCTGNSHFTGIFAYRRRFSSSKISMSLRAGIVGLPNVGKSTLFNAVVSHSFPFLYSAIMLLCFKN